ncbi:dockerin type I domain-containing protein [Mucisphaera calidilacus]|uniref:Dockerin domain-containing protein n=1 Tax=Mucisphaera calidilacus TaxID=2527982 RepID=A0A518BU38_9BACT|nr:dockerin type I domain-containing protein [Mucisphaera calidilacus]QDU70503.1 hypothetical protein Pan265_03310 [Mucisphaera calidilacus]
MLTHTHRNRLTLGSLLLALACLLPSQSAEANYDTLWSIGSIRTASNFNYASTHTFAGDSGYFILRDVESGITPTFDMQITKLESLDDSPVKTTLVSAADWLAYTGNSSILPGSRSRVLGSSLQFLDQSTDAIYRADTTTGDLSTLITATDILALTGLTELQVRGESTFDAAGNMYLYEDRSDQVIKVTTEGALSVFLTKAELQGIVGDASLSSYVSGGLAFDDNDNFFWTLSGSSFTSSNNARGSIYQRASDGTLSQALPQEEIVPVSRSDPFFGADYAAFNDLILGADGLLYLYERGNDALLRFDPDDPIETLERVLDTSQLLAGGMSSENINDFSVYGAKLTWTSFVANDGIYGITLDVPDVLPGDANEDGVVDLLDLSILASNFDGSDTPYATSEGDFNGDGLVDLLDLSILAANFSSGDSVPAPGTLITGMIGLAVLTVRRSG